MHYGGSPIATYITNRLKFDNETERGCWAINGHTQPINRTLKGGTQFMSQAAFPSYI